MLLDTIVGAILHPSKLLKVLINMGLLNAMDDESYIRLCYHLHTGKVLDLNNPKTFNEKIQWLKLNYRRPEYTTLVDKYKVREYIANTIGGEYLTPLLGVWERAEDIDFNALPDQFVLKCNHNSGIGMCICTDKSKLDTSKVRRELNRGLRQDYYLTGREWAYNNVPRRIIAEQYLTDDGFGLKDYKFFCFNGEPRLIQVDFDRFVGHKRNLYTTDWQYFNGEIEYPADPNVMIPRPETLNIMLDLARKLSAGYPHVRIDFYSIKGKVYFGEMTFYHGSGYEHFSPASLGEMMGGWMNLVG